MLFRNFQFHRRDPILKTGLGRFSVFCFSSAVAIFCRNFLTTSRDLEEIPLLLVLLAAGNDADLIDVADFEPKRLTGSLVAGFDPNMPPAGLSELDAAGFEPKRFTGGASDFGVDDSLDDPKRFTAGLDAAVSEVVLAPNKPPPDGASSFFLSSVGAEAAVVVFDPNNPPDPNPGFGRAGFSFSVSTGGALTLIPPPSGGGVSGVIVFDRI